MGAIVCRTIVTNGIATVFAGTELDRLMQENQKILEQGQQIIQNNNLIFDRCQQIQKNIDEIWSHTSLGGGGSQNNDTSWFQQFIERGKQGADYAIHPKNQDVANQLLDPNKWSEFVFDVIKKTLWLLWNSFMGITHWLCIIVCVAGIIAFIAGYKKGGVISICSIVLYILLRLINMAIGG